MSDEFTEYGLPKDWDGAVPPRHVFYIRNAVVDLDAFDWPDLGPEGGLQWAIFPLAARTRGMKDGHHENRGRS